MRGVFKVLDLVGYFTPLLLFFVTSFLLFHNKLFWLAFAVGLPLNIGTNILLKLIFHQPRPSGDRVHIFTLGLKETELRTNTLFSDGYGMPSSHAQIAFFCTAMVHYALGNVFITATYLLVALNSVRERLVYKNHNVFQVAVGALLGLFLGFCANTYVHQRGIIRR